MYSCCKSTRTSKQRHSALIESLETRQMMANNNGMLDVDLNTHHEAPPAIVEYAGIDPDQNSQSSLPIDPNSNTPTESRSLSVYNATFGGSDFGRGVYWTSLSPWCSTGKVDITRAAVERVAAISQNGGLAIWRNTPVKSHALTVLDFESPLLDNKSPTYIADRLRWFKAKAPDAKVGIFGHPLHSITNLDYLAVFDEKTRAEFDRQVLANREIIDNSDFINFDAYLLGRGWEERDMKARKNVADELHRLFPDKPIIPFVWGAYHTNWNPENDVFSDEVSDRYVQMAAQSYDGVIIWGPREDNEKLVTRFQQSDLTVLPSGRKGNWGNQATTQDPPSSRPSGATGSNSTPGTVVDDVLAGT